MVENRPAFLASVLCASLLGALLFFSRLGDPLAWLSFDAPFLFRSADAREAVMITMDESTYGDPELNPGYKYPQFNRATHARLLDKLRADGASLVVFDIFFADETPEDAALAAAIRNHGNVIIAAAKEKRVEIDMDGSRIIDPAPAFLELPGCRIALPDLPPGVVRMFPRERDDTPSIPVAAVAAMGAPVEPFSTAPRWAAYYGDAGTLPSGTYQSALTQAPGHFADKVVFIGGKPKIDHLLGTKDEFYTPFTRWTRLPMRGVEIHATMFLNLIRKEWLTRISARNEFLLVVGAALLFGWGVTLFRPLPGLLLVFVAAISISALAIVLFWTQRIWFNWVLIGWVQTPLAWATSALIYSRNLHREKETLQKELESIKSARPAPDASSASVKPSLVLADLNLDPAQDAPVAIRDFELLQQIGEGAYGQVWLARNLVGAYRAIKILYRKNFPEQRPFEREFEGVRNFVPISGSHPGWVSVLHVGKDDAAGFFYYVMDPADDLVQGAKIDPAHYAPKTLGKLLVEKQWLPVLECVQLGIHLADALAALHRHDLIHRDVKPSNIIFANGRPKLADIGLVAHLSESKSFVGTEGFIPPDGPGTAIADIFGLGRVLYQAATGCPPDRHPGLPTALGERSDSRDLMRLMEIINKACARFHGDRYQSAAELHDDLVKLEIDLRDMRP